MQFTVWERIMIANEQKKIYLEQEKSAKKYSRQTIEETENESERVEHDTILKYQ